jgi:twinkle protein
MKISEQSIKRVKDTMMAKDIIGQFFQLKKDGTNLVCKCPFHNENSPSFKVHINKDLYKCFGCGVSGNSIDFLIAYKKLEFTEALKEIANYYHIELDMEETKQKKVYAKPTPKPYELSQVAIKYFQDVRGGISEKTLKDLKVTTVKTWMPKAKSEVEAICFNYFRNNELVNVKYRAKDKDFKLEKDAELIFYNLDAIKRVKEVVLVEGEIDALTLHECGIKKVISVPNGATGGTAQLEYLENCASYFNGVEQIILMTDNDEVGGNLQKELLNRFGYDRCFKVEYPEGCKDANDILVKYGRDKVREVVMDAKPFPIEGILDFEDLEKEVRYFYENGYPDGVDIPIQGFEDLLQLMLGQFTTVTGHSGAGKSEFVDYIMTEISKKHGWQWGVCSFENQPSSYHVTKLMEKVVGKSFAKRRNKDAQITDESYSYSVDFVRNHFHFMNLDKINVTVDGILDKAKELKIAYGIKGLLIDPYNYIEFKQEKGQTETQYISLLLTKLKAFAASHQVHVILVAHPAKPENGSGKLPIPKLRDIAGSVHFWNKTDNGICVYRDYEELKTDVHIQKVRYSWLGRIGAASFTFNAETRQFESIEAGVIPLPKDKPF